MAVALVMPMAICARWTQPSKAEDPYHVVLLHAWEIDPDLPVQWYYFQPGEANQHVDLERLRSASRQHRVEEAQQILVKVGRGEVDNREAALHTLLDVLGNDEETNRTVRTVLVSAAASLVQSPAEAAALWQALEDDPHAQLLLEPRLIRWRSEMAIDRWRARLQQALPLPTERLLVAIEGLATFGSEADADLVESVLLAESTLLPVRLAAAEALGSLRREGGEQLAEQFLASSLPHSGMVALRLLAHHDSPRAVALIQQLVDGGTAIEQAHAYSLLANMAPESALAIANRMLSHTEVAARRQAARLLDTQQDATSLNQLATLLGDRNVHLRREVRERLRRKAQNANLQPLVDEIVAHFLASERFEGVEQAIVLAQQLRRSKFAAQVVQLLDHPRPEVFVRAAWCLQDLSLDPELLEAITKRLGEVTQRLESGAQISFDEEVAAAYLMEAVGKHGYRPAVPWLRKYIPKNGHKMRALPRTSAIYALGLLYQDSRDEALAAQLAGRMLDDNPFDPEDTTVQYAATIAIGRIAHAAGLEQLQRVPDEPPMARAVAARWAIERIVSQAR